MKITRPRLPEKLSKLGLATVFVVIAAGTVTIVTLRNRAKRRQQLQALTNPDAKHVDIGAIFGLDVGGTLSKLVYFEPTRRSKRIDQHGTKRRTFFFFDNPRKKKMFKRSQSLENLNTPRHTMALESFYEFVNAEGSPFNRAELRDENLTFYSRILGGELHFMKFETRYVDRVVDIVKSNRLHQSINSIGCTGGGAYKFSNLFLERLGINLRKMDELDCLMRGLEFVLQHVVGECYTYKCEPSKFDQLDPSVLRGLSSAAMDKLKADGKLPKGGARGRTGSADSDTTDYEFARSPGIPETPESSPRARSSRATSSPDTSPRSNSDPPAPAPPLSSRSQQKENREWKYKVQRSGENVIYPFIVCNIGSGVSILKVESPGKYERVSGSSIGGGTYWGLCRLLTRVKTFDEVLDLAESGEAALVDMTVGDIYGRNYDKFHLSSTVTASSFGKLVMKQNPGEGVREEDLARALLLMITGNIGQVAYLNACIYKATHIYFVGNFLRHNKISCRRLAFAIDYWSGGKMEALFLEHEGYFGALGAFLYSSIAEDTGPPPSNAGPAKLVKQQTFTQGMPYPEVNLKPLTPQPPASAPRRPSGQKLANVQEAEEDARPVSALRKQYTIAGYKADDALVSEDRARERSNSGHHEPRHFNFPDVPTTPVDNTKPKTPTVTFKLSS